MPSAYCFLPFAYNLQSTVYSLPPPHHPRPGQHQQPRHRDETHSGTVGMVTTGSATTKSPSGRGLFLGLLAKEQGQPLVEEFVIHPKVGLFLEAAEGFGEIK